MTFLSNSNDTRTAFYYSLESLTQCASKEFSPIALRYSVQVLSSDETSHVYRNEAIPASNPAVFIATKISKLIYKNLSLCEL